MGCGSSSERSTGAVEPKTKKEPAAEDPSPAAPSETETKEESEEVKDNGGGGEVPSMAHDYQPRYSEDCNGPEIYFSDENPNGCYIM